MPPIIGVVKFDSIITNFLNNIEDSIVKNYLLPFLGLVILTFSYFIYRKGRNDYVKQKQ